MEAVMLEVEMARPAPEPSRVNAPSAQARLRAAIHEDRKTAERRASHEEGLEGVNRDSP